MRHLLLLAIAHTPLISGRKASGFRKPKAARPGLQVYAAPYLRGTGNEPGTRPA